MSHINRSFALERPSPIPKCTTDKKQDWRLMLAATDSKYQNVILSAAIIRFSFCVSGFSCYKHVLPKRKLVLQDLKLTWKAKLLLCPLSAYIMLCFSAPLLPTGLLSFIRSRGRTNDGVGFPTNSAWCLCFFENKHLCSNSFVLRSNLRFILPWFYLSPPVSTSSRRMAKCFSFSLSYLLTPDRPRPTSHRKSMPLCWQQLNQH